jgi:CelD/BcsL family acetyltransferase involved in cellulose biosynthesis
LSLNRELGAAVSPCLGDREGIYEIDPLHDPRWPEFVKQHPRASVFHTPNWLNALHSAYGYEPAVLSTSAPRERLTNGLVFCRLKSRLTGNRLVSLPFSDHCEPLVETKEELDAILVSFTKAVGNQWKYVELRPTEQVLDGMSGFTQCHCYYWHYLDLSPDRDALFRRFHKDCVQRKIRRAQREGLSYEAGNSEELLRKFYRLLILTRRRHGLPPQPYFWFQQLSRSLGEQMQVRIASHNGTPVAGIVTLKHGKTIVYKYGGSDARFNRLGGTALLFWQTILEAKREGLSQLDLGRVDLDNEGLIQFKEHWGARRATLTYLKFPGLPDITHYRFSGPLLRAAVRVAPEWCLIAAGKFLYPHIG